jgi:hypothetical protein
MLLPPRALQQHLLLLLLLQDEVVLLGPTCPQLLLRGPCQSSSALWAAPLLLLHAVRALAHGWVEARASLQAQRQDSTTEHHNI